MLFFVYSFQTFFVFLFFLKEKNKDENKKKLQENQKEFLWFYFNVRFDDSIIKNPVRLGFLCWCVCIYILTIVVVVAVSNLSSLLRMMRIVCHSDKRQVLFACFRSCDVGAKAHIRILICVSCRQPTSIDVHSGT